jgi:hypothetical protein
MEYWKELRKNCEDENNTKGMIKKRRLPINVTVKVGEQNQGK